VSDFTNVLTRGPDGIGTLTLDRREQLSASAGRIHAEARAPAADRASRALLALARAQQAVYGTATSSLAETLEMEMDYRLRCFQREDAREGLQAFRAKRDPIFRGV
jgi:enoyl-CoA hydratase/carnithine racemase